MPLRLCKRYQAVAKQGRGWLYENVLPVWLLDWLDKLTRCRRRSGDPIVDFIMNWYDVHVTGFIVNS
jgi:hypothetical protein